MRIAFLAQNRIVISRMTAVSGYKKAMSTVTGVVVNLQPISAEKTALMGGVMGKTFMIYCDPGTNIQENDLIRDCFSNKKYKVKAGGVTTYSHGSIEYIQVLIEEIR